eukprot:TRINITY_DN6862_c0_g2_i1.p1 TRINITY_DN6862_c0_g2~~TRINITY_DN6862_c0_g2_i1.p1  ORF type:complete len:679 (-),score=152.71 TRINITY_DN6862_c0_g2_i1:426-2327(-)
MAGASGMMPDQYGSHMQGYGVAEPDRIEESENHALKAVAAALDRAEVDMLMGGRRRPCDKFSLDNGGICGSGIVGDGHDLDSALEDMLKGGRSGGGDEFTNFALKAASEALGAMEASSLRFGGQASSSSSTSTKAAPKDDVDLSLAAALGLKKSDCIASASKPNAARSRRAPLRLDQDSPVPEMPISTGAAPSSGPNARRAAREENNARCRLENESGYRNYSGYGKPSALEEEALADLLGEATKSLPEKFEEVQLLRDDFPSGASEVLKISDDSFGEEQLEASQGRQHQSSTEMLNPGVSRFSLMHGPDGKTAALPESRTSAGSDSHYGSRGNLLDDDDEDDELEQMALREMEEEMYSGLHQPHRQNVPSSSAMAAAALMASSPTPQVPMSSYAHRPPSGRTSGQGTPSYQKDPLMGAVSSNVLPQSRDRQKVRAASRGASPNPSYVAQYEAPPDHLVRNSSSRSASRSRGCANTAFSAEDQGKHREDRRNMLVDCILNEKLRASTPRRATTPRKGQGISNLIRSTSRGPASTPHKRCTTPRSEDVHLRKVATPHGRQNQVDQAGQKPAFNLNFLDAQPPSPSSLPKLTPRSAGPDGRAPLPAKQRSQKGLVSVSGSQSARGWRRQAGTNMLF